MAEPDLSLPRQAEGRGGDVPGERGCWGGLHQEGRHGRPPMSTSTLETLKPGLYNIFDVLYHTKQSLFSYCDGIF